MIGETKGVTVMDFRLPQCRPADVGLDKGRLDAAHETLAKGLAADEYTAAVYLVARHGKIAAYGAMGRTGGDESDPPAAIDSIFDMASVTKPVATAASLMSLVDAGVLHLGQPAEYFFPERNLPHLQGIAVKHLATHISGLPAWKPLYSNGGTSEGSIEELLQKTPLENPVGAKFVYSCLGYITLGLILEQASGKPLEKLAVENIFKPLGMKDSGHNPPKSKKSRIVKTAFSQFREGCLWGEVHDENANSLNGNAGNAGLFSTAPDIAIFAQMILNGGEFDGVRVLSPLAVKRMITNQINPSIGGQGYGFFTYPNDMVPSGDLFSNSSAGHTGFTGTSLLIDPEYDMFVILLTNRVYKDRDGAKFMRRRRWFHNIVASSVR